MKIIGALIFIMMTTWIGYDWSLQLQKRTKQLRSLIYSLQLMEAEMGYTYAPLQKVFSSVHEKTTEPVSYFYKYLQQALTESVSDFSEVWEHALEYFFRQDPVICMEHASGRQCVFPFPVFQLAVKAFPVAAAV